MKNLMISLVLVFSFVSFSLAQNLQTVSTNNVTAIVGTFQQSDKLVLLQNGGSRLLIETKFVHNYPSQSTRQNDAFEQAILPEFQPTVTVNNAGQMTIVQPQRTRQILVKGEVINVTATFKVSVPTQVQSVNIQ
jgi:hypothetical protein